MRLARLTLIVATTAACACADAGTVPPASAVGTFTLASYNGAALPAYVDSRLGPCSVMIVAGSLTAANDGHVEFSRSYSPPCVQGQSVGTELRTGHLSVDGTTVTIALDADALNPAQVYTGTLQGGQITLYYTVNNLATPLQQTFVLVRS